MRRPLVTLALVAGLVSGCSLAPPYHQPSVPIASTYPTAEALGVRAASTIDWQDYFGDPRLRAYIAAALANNRDLAAAVARIEEAHANFRIQNAQRLPEVDLGGSGTRAQTPSSVLESQAGVSGAPGAKTSVTSDLYGAQVAVTAFELDFWGRVHNLSEAQRRQYLASIEGADRKSVV